MITEVSPVRKTSRAVRRSLFFGICFLMIYLILSALYESFIIPFAVLLSVPCGLMGSFLFAWMFGLENNIICKQV